MSSGNPSRTALATAYLRAAHQLLDDAPRLLDDPLAVTLLGPAAPGQIRAAAERYRSPGARELRSHVLVRSRFAEDRLAEAVSRGATQYMVLGAGFDTFAFRQPAWAAGLRIVEVDALATQQVKRGMLRAAGLAEPPNVTFADIDVEREPLRDGLLRHGVDDRRVTFVSWLGVTMYLTPEAVDAVLGTLAAFPAGSEVVLTFAWPPAEPGAGAPPSSLADRAARAGEPWLTFFVPPALEEILRAKGFSEVHFLAPTEARARYFAGRSDVPAPRLATIVSAIR